MFGKHFAFSNKVRNLERETDVEIPEEKLDFFQNANAGALADPYPIGPQTQATRTSMPQPTVDNPMPSATSSSWLDPDNTTYEGQLAIDVYQDKKNIYIKATIAGVRPENIDIQLNNDLVTIKGKRCFQQEIAEDDYYIKECYWGGFSRSIILPVDVKTDQVKATLEHGLLTIVLPKSKRPRNTRIEVQPIS